MNFDNKKYISKLFKFSDQVQGIEMSFEDKNIEGIFLISNWQNDTKKLKIFLLFNVIFYICAIAQNLIKNNYLLFNRSIYCLLGGLIFDLIVFKVSIKIQCSLKIYSLFKNFRFFIMYFNCYFQIMFPVNQPDPNSCGMSRIVLAFIIFNNFLYLYYLDFNILILICIPILNSFLILYIEIAYTFPRLYFSFEFSLNFLYYIPSFFIKKNEFFNEKKKFFELYKNEQYIEYISQLINVLNTMIISVKKQEVLFMNNFAINYFKNKKNFRIRDEIKENESLISFLPDDNSETIHSYMNSFFGSLILETPLENPKIEFGQGKSLRDIISQILCSDEMDSKEFTKIGFFKSLDYPNFFEIFVRKLKLKEEVVELFINDISEIKQAEKIKTETKYKQKILAKIAHEFKTPLITIISLVQKIMTQQSEVNVSIKNSLNHINNFSNYTLVLISDIIQYVSNSMNLILIKNEIVMREVMDFSYNVLKTLVECNENKVNKVKTIMEIDENIDNLTIISDENRLKQIFLNFISNAVKFTKTGFIKIKVKYIKENQSAEISIEDSGLGIKIDDHPFIFKENVQINVDKEYNSKGTGLGLSITKTLSDSLNHEIGFSSKLGEGSIFYLRIKCPNIMKNKKKQTNTSSINNINYDCFLTRMNDNEINCVSMTEISSESLNNIINEYNKISNEKKNIKNIKLEENMNISSFGFSIDGTNFDNNLFSILVVDDHQFVRQNTVNLIKSVLSSLNICNFRIIEGCDGIDLLNFVRNDKENKIKLIFTDENMEFLNGSQAVKLIRKFEKNQNIKTYEIISITAFDDEETKNYIYKSGINVILSKPCTKSEILKYLIKCKNLN